MQSHICAGNPGWNLAVPGPHRVFIIGVLLLKLISISAPSGAVSRDTNRERLQS